MIVLLILGTIVDLLLAALLIAVSGFVFGGPEGGHGEITGVLMWSFRMVCCAGAPVGGFLLRAKGRPGTGIIVAWVPPLAGC